MALPKQGAHWRIYDRAPLQRAIELAERGRGSADPNPLVGAVLMKDEEQVGQGWHQRAGEPHAEVLALEEAGEGARGATLYINLEPCCHYGRTPPCVPRLIEAGVARVVAALVDPDPRVSGQGLEALIQAGLDVVLAPPEIARECALQNRFFLASVRNGRPFVTIKFAISLDGKLASRSGHSQWITGEEARYRGHRERADHQALLVGRGTVQQDDPHLNVRAIAGARQPLRVILDSIGSLPLSARVLSSAGGSVLFATTARSPAIWREGLVQKGAEVVVLEEDDDGRVSLRALLNHLHHNGIRSLLAEGGSKLHGSLIDEGLVTRVLGFIAPRIVGGEEAPGPIGGMGAETMGQALALRHVKAGPIGGDFLIEGYLDDSWLNFP